MPRSFCEKPGLGFSPRQCHVGQQHSPACSKRCFWPASTAFTHNQLYPMPSRGTASLPRAVLLTGTQKPAWDTVRWDPLSRGLPLAPHLGYPDQHPLRKMVEDRGAACSGDTHSPSPGVPLSPLQHLIPTSHEVCPLLWHLHPAWWHLGSGLTLNLQQPHCPFLHVTMGTGHSVPGPQKHLSTVS